MISVFVYQQNGKECIKRREDHGPILSSEGYAMFQTVYKLFLYMFTLLVSGQWKVDGQGISKEMIDKIDH